MKPTAEELAGAVREMVRSWGMTEGQHSDEELAILAMLAAILDEPQPQASGTVAEMFEAAEQWLNDPDLLSTKRLRHWATELEVAQQTIRDLAGTIAALQGDLEAANEQICRLECIVSERESWIKELEATEAKDGD